MKKIIKFILSIISLSIVFLFFACKCDGNGPIKFSLVAPDGAPIVALADTWGESVGNMEISYSVTSEAKLGENFASGTEFILAPINLGVNMHNAYCAGKVAYDYKLLNVTSWGVLYFVTTADYEGYSSGKATEFLSQFDGKALATIGREAIPGKTVEYLFGEANANVSMIASDASTIQQSIVKGEEITAVFAEPAISALKSQGKSFEVLGSVSDIYSEITGEDFPMSGIFVRADVYNKNVEDVKAFDNFVKRSVDKFNENPLEVGNKAQNIEGCSVNGNVLALAFDKMNVRHKTAQDSKTAVVKLLNNIGVNANEDCFIR